MGGYGRLVILTQHIEGPHDHRPRAAGQSKYTNWGRLKETLWDLWAVRWMQKRFRPIRAEELPWKR